MELVPALLSESSLCGGGGGEGVSIGEQCHISEDVVHAGRRPGRDANVTICCQINRQMKDKMKFCCRLVNIS
jgi:hypothetical protein